MKTATIQPAQVRYGYKFCPEIIFDAWLKPDMICKWLFVGPNSKLINIDIDAHEGGHFSILELDKTTGQQIDHYGDYKILDSPRRLQFTLSVPQHFPGETEVMVDIVPQPGGCYVDLTQTGVPPRTTAKNWRNMLERLDVVLKEMARKTF